MLILATDMARHAEIMDSFKDKLAVNFDFNNKEHMDTVCIEHMDRLCAERMNKLWIEHMAMLCSERIGCGRLQSVSHFVSNYNYRSRKILYV